MQIKIPILTALIVLTSVLAIPLASHPVGAIPGNDVTSPLNVWTPYGPNPNAVNKIQYQYYATETSEFQQFELGKIDLTDWELPPAKYASYDANPDWLLTPNQGQYGDYGTYFNGLSSRFTVSPETGQGAFWGCNWNTGTAGTTSLQTYVSACGINMRQAFSHLIDRPTFSNNFGGLAALACDSPPAKSPTCVTTAQQCAWDPMFPTCIDAYRIAPNLSGFAAPGSPDFCAAADHMIAAGIATAKTAGTCVLTGVNAGVFAHPLRDMIRNNDPRRLAMGNGLMNAINQLFGGQVVTPTYGNIRQIGFPIVFSDPPDGPLDDWDAYTFGYLLGSPYPDHLYGLYNSVFASDYCGTGIQSGEPNNPQFVCTTTIDSATKAAAQTADVPTFTTATLNAFDQLGKIAVDIPTFTPAIRIPALRSMASGSSDPGLVNVKGVAYNSAQNILYPHKGSYNPVNPIFTFGGGDPTTLRYGQASGTSELNVFNAQTVWEFQAIGEIYDTLFSSSPVDPGTIFCWMCATYTKSVDAALNTHFAITLKQNLHWQDGQPVTAYDVKFTWLNFRDAPTTISGNLPGLLLDIKITDNQSFDVIWLGQSISFPVYMENFVIPEHLWRDSACTTPAVAGGNILCPLADLPGSPTTCPIGASSIINGVTYCLSASSASTGLPSQPPAYTDVSVVDPVKVGTSYDPLTSGTLIGSGPYACLSVFASDLGKVGTGCGKNADQSRASQALGIGATLLLQAYDFTAVTGNSPQDQYMRSYNNNWGTGSGATAQSGQFQAFRWADYNSLSRPGGDSDPAIVSATDVATVSLCFGATSGATNPVNCPTVNYVHAQNNAFHISGSGTLPGQVGNEEVAVAATAYTGDTWLSQYVWTQAALPNVVPYPATP